MPEPASRRAFALAVATAAALGMALQPMIGKQVLVAYGGTPAAWSVVLAFFQLALLGGYALAHLVATRVGDRRGGVAYLGLLVLAACLLPPRLPALDPTTGAGALGIGLPLLAGLVVAVGPAAVALFATAPLLQRWYAGRSGTDPYPLYAASNFGSLVGLLAFPFVVEPALDRDAQAWGFTGAFVGLTLGLAWLVRGRRGPAADPAVAPARIDGATRRRWLVAAAVPSAALSAVTAHVTTDLAPVPLLWVVPLGVYFATWVVAFSPAGPAVARVAMPVLPLATAVVAPLAILAVGSPVVGVTATLVGWLALVGLALHGELAHTHPDAANLTRFYLWIAAGGALGGAAIAFVAPAVLSRAIDLPLVLVATLVVVRPALGTRRGPLLVAAIAVAALGIAVLAAARTTERGGTTLALAPFGWWVVAWLPSVRRPRAGALVLAGLVGLAVVAVQTRRPALAVSRSFFAAYRVVDDPEAGLRWLSHGRTIHGAVAVERPGECLPYHHPHGPAAALFRELPAHARVAIVGLGIGCMADLAPADATIDFIEIDAEVERLARAHFDALARCGARCSVEIADGRQALARPGPAYDLVVLDAFASDAIPVHLVTAEALAHYAARLREGGTIAVHVTNRHVDLAAVVIATARRVGLRAVVGAYDPSADVVADPDTVADLYAATRFVALSRAGIGPASDPATGLVFGPGAPSSARPWTDAHAPLADALMNR